MYQFDYTAPNDLASALDSLRAAEDGKYLAGGMTLIPTLKQRLAQPSDLVDLGKITALKGVRRVGNTLVIGAMTTHATVAANEIVAQTIPALAGLAGNIGDAQVRHRGTIGGSICNNDPAADYPGAVVGLGASIVTDRRTIAADDFFTGLFETALETDEIVTEIHFPIPQKAAYVKFPNPASRYAIVGVFVAVTTAGAVRLAVTGAGATVFRLPDFEAALATAFTPDAITGLTVPSDELNADIHAGADYRAHLIGVIAGRAIAACA